MCLFFVPLGGLGEQPSGSWPNATATNASIEEAREGNVRPHQAWGYFFLSVVVNFT